MKKFILFTLGCALTPLSAAPTVAALGVKNAASYSNPGFPNGSVAQGSLFVVFGSAMGPDPIQYASSFPLPSNLMGTSINVTVNGMTLPCPMIYTSSGQLAAILPSTTPTGTGTMVVSYNGTSNAAPIKVVPSSPGIFTVNEQGTGPSVVQDGNGHQNALNFAFNPNQTVVVWLTGLGPISGSDAGVPPSGNLPGVTVTANVGGKSAPVVYSGRSSNAGVDQVNITLPAGVTGCYVPIYLVASPANGPAVTSNFGTISIAASGSTCSDPNFPNISNGKGYKSGYVSLSRSMSSLSLMGQTFTTNIDSGSGSFYSYDPNYLASVGSFSFIDVTNGACSVIQVNGSSSGNPLLPTALDAGPVINVNGPNGAKQMAKNMGFYSATLGQNSTPTIPGLPNSPLYLDPGNYTVDNGSGGTDVGPFKLNITVPPLFTWTNQSSITSIDRTQPLQITWTGGDPNAQVQVLGSSSVDTTASVSFICYAKDSDLQLTVPPAILGLLPPSATISGTAAGLLYVSTNNSVTGTASGLDYLYLTNSTSYPKNGIAYK
jgi:uncharacterized protein (TIGR03437 family)